MAQDTHIDEKGRAYTLTARDRIEDVAFHSVYLQEAFVTVLDNNRGVTQQHDLLLSKIEHALAALASRVDGEIHSPGPNGA